MKDEQRQLKLLKVFQCRIGLDPRSLSPHPEETEYDDSEYDTPDDYCYNEIHHSQSTVMYKKEKDAGSNFLPDINKS